LSRRQLASAILLAIFVISSVATALLLALR